MSLWSWYRRRRWWWKIALALPAALIAGVALYSAVRALQYASEEREAGLFVPAGADVVVRAHALARHWDRIREGEAWATVRDRILADRPFRRQANFLLEDLGLPTLDELEDVRKGGKYSSDLILRAAGRDAVLSARVGDAWASTKWCAATRVSYFDFLLAPLARLALRSESMDGRRVFKVRAGGRDLWVTFEGSVAVAGNDREFLAEALRRKGRGGPTKRPLEGRADFGSSTALASLRRTIQRSGLLPHVNAETIRGVSFSVDVQGAAVQADLILEGAEPTHPDSAPPAALAALAPASASSYWITSAGLHDIHAWLRFLVERSGPKDMMGKNAKIALETLEAAGFEKEFLPKVGAGLTLLTGAEEREGLVIPTIALIFPSKDPKATAEAMGRIIEWIAKSEAGKRMRVRELSGTELFYFEWQKGVQLVENLTLNDFMTPAYAAGPNWFVLGNNVNFVESILRVAAEEEENFQNTASYRALAKKFKEYGMAQNSPHASGAVFAPLLKESCDPLLRLAAKWQIEREVDTAKLRAAIEKERREQGLPMVEEEIGKQFQAALQARTEERERSLREGIRFLDRLRWFAWESAVVAEGLSLRAVVELEAPRRGR